MKTKCALFLLVVFGAVGFAAQTSWAERASTYLALKGGLYSPSANFNLDNVDLQTAFDGNTKTGFDGEIAIGHYILPTLALELGAGYFKGKGSVATPTPHDVNFNVVPVILSAKALIPAGPIDPYGELGIGAYFTTLKVTDNLNSFSGTSTFGLHAGAGLNINVTESVFIGVEGRYVWANPSFGDRRIRLNDTEYALNGFKLNGFTTTLDLGFGF